MDFGGTVAGLFVHRAERITARRPHTRHTDTQTSPRMDTELVEELFATKCFESRPSFVS